MSAQTPPAFLVHASDDVAVPPANSRAFVAALETHGVPVEYLELPRGGHGLNKVPGPMWEQWQQACIAWMTGRGILRRTGHAPANAAPAAR